MIVLGIDAATDRLSVAAGAPGGRQASRAVSGARRHAGLLPRLVLEVLEELGAALGDVRGLAVSDGPGSFTGLRVAASWAKGVWRARGLPCWTASTLLVRACRGAGPGRVVLGVGSALRGELYVGGYRFTADGIETVIAPAVAAPGQGVLAGVSADVLVGDLSPAVMEAWGIAASVIGGTAGSPDAGQLIDLIGRRGGARRIDDPSAWEPEYGRPAEAQAKWERVHGRPLSDSAGRSG